MKGDPYVDDVSGWDAAVITVPEFSSEMTLYVLSNVCRRCQILRVLYGSVGRFMLC